ncbi:hypothetical protein, partial [Streptomyces sp. NPDC001274]
SPGRISAHPSRANRRAAREPSLTPDVLTMRAGYKKEGPGRESVRVRRAVPGKPGRVDMADARQVLLDHASK